MRVPFAPSLFRKSLAVATFIALMFVAAPHAQAACPSHYATGTLIRITGALKDLEIDKDCTHLFVLNATNNAIEMYALSTGTKVATIAVGTNPRKMDFTPDGSQLYVANWGERTISQVDVAQRREIKKITLPTSNYGNPFAVAVTSGGGVRISAAPSLIEYNPGTGSFITLGSSSVNTLESNRDHTRISTTSQALSGNGAYGVTFPASTTYAAPSAVYNSANRLLGQVFDSPGAMGAAVDQTGDVAYLITTTSLDIIDLPRMIKTKSLALGDTIPENNETFAGVSRLGPDDKLLAYITQRGVVLQNVPGTAKTGAEPSGSAGRALTDGRTGTSPCATNLELPLAVKVTGGLSAIMFDDHCRYVFAANAVLNQIEVFSLQTGELLPPIFVGSRPSAFDISADGQRMYVANGGASTLSTVDLTTGRLASTTYLPATSGEAETLKGVVVMNNGRVLIGASGGFGRLLSFDPGTSAFSTFNTFVRVEYNTKLKASGDRSTVIIGGASNAPFRYNVGTNKFTEATDRDLRMPWLALDQTGSTLLASTYFPGAAVLDANFGVRGKFTACCASHGLALDPSGTTAYQVSGGLNVFELGTFKLTKSLPVGDTLVNAGTFGIGSVEISRDGKMLAVITDNGFSLVSPSAVPQNPSTGTPQVGACSSTIAASFIAKTKLSNVFIDDQCKFIYTTNSEKNELHVFSIATGQQTATIPVGLAPRGIDASVDGKLIYVANSGESSISIVDVAAGVQKAKVPLSDATLLALDVAVAKNGRVIISAKHNRLSSGDVLQYDPQTNAITRRADFGSAVTQYARATASVSLTPSADRSTIIVTVGNISSGPIIKYDSDANSFTHAYFLSGFVDQRVAVSDGGKHVLFYDRILNSRMELVAQTSGCCEAFDDYYAVAVDSAGGTAYKLTRRGIDVINVATTARIGTLSLGQGNVVPSDGDSMALSRDAKLLVFSSAQGVSIIPTTPSTKPTARFVAFSSSQADNQSYIRVHNAGAAAATVNMKLSDAATGTTLGTWTTPSIAGGAEPQFHIKVIENAALPASTPRPPKYTVTIEPTDVGFSGYVQNVLWRPSDGTLTNLSTCSANVTTDGYQLVGVHSSLLSGDYASTVVIRAHDDFSAGKVTLAVYNAETGGFLGRYTSPSISRGAQLMVPIEDIEAAAKINAAASNIYSYVVVAEGPFLGYLQHLVNNKSRGVISDMTAACALNATPVRPATQTKLQLGSVFPTTQGQSQSYVRLINTGGFTSQRRITLYDGKAGSFFQQLKVWTHPSTVPLRTSQQYWIGQLEDGTPSFTRPNFYTVGVNYAGYVQHVLWRVEDGTLTNLSTCYSGVGTIPGKLNNVHSSLVSERGYPSSVVVHNTGTTAATATLAVNESTTGTLYGSYTTPSIPPDGALTIPVSDIEAGVPSLFGRSIYHYDITLQSGFTGYMQHLVTNSGSGVITDMTTVCKIN